MAIVPTGGSEDFFRSRKPDAGTVQRSRHIADLDSRPATEPEIERADATTQFWQQRRDADTAAAEVYAAAAKADPNKAARANQLATWTGMPAAAVERNIGDVEHRVRTDAFRQMIAGNPQLSGYFANPRNVAAASDDVPTLASISAHFQAFWKPLAAKPNWQANVDSELARDRDFNVMAANNANAHGIFPRIGALLDKGLTGLQAGGARLEGAVSRALGFEDHANAMDLEARRNEMVAGTSLPGEQTWDDLKKSHFAPGRAFNFVAEQTVQSLPGMLTAVEGLPLFVATQSGAIGQQRALNNGRSSANLGDVLAATPAAVASAYLERVGGHAILTPAASSAFKRIATAAWKEGATEFLQGDIEYAGGTVGTTKGYDDATAFDQALQGAFVGAGMGGGVRSSYEGGVRAVVAAQNSVVVAHVGDMVMSRLMALAGASKLRARDPDAFQQFVAQQAAGTPAENIYVPAETIRQLYQDEGREWTDPEDDLFGSMTPDFREQMAAGLATGGDVVIPTAAAAAHLAGTPAWEAIKADARMTPGGFSVNEANASEAEQGETIDALGKRIGEEAKAQIEAGAPRQKVYEAILEGARRNGYSANAARQYADLWAERYQTRAERLGGAKTAFDLFEESFAGFNAATPATVKPYGTGDQLDVLINAMRKGAEAAAPQGPSLLKRIMSTGGIEDRGGDIAAMGGDKIQAGGHFGRKIQRLIAEHDDAQGSFDGTSKGNTRSPDYLIDELWHEGYFGNAQERPSIDDLLALIDKELHGEPVHPERGDGRAAETQDQIAQAAGDLRQMLDQRGLDPETATKAEIAQAMRDADAVAEGGRGLDQEGRRGRIDFQSDGRAVISMFEARDLSTLLHEGGHLWLEELRTDALQSVASEPKVRLYRAEGSREASRQGIDTTEGHLWFALDPEIAAKYANRRRGEVHYLDLPAARARQLLKAGGGTANIPEAEAAGMRRFTDLADARKDAEDDVERGSLSPDEHIAHVLERSAALPSTEKRSGAVFADWETVKAWFKREGVEVDDAQPIPTEAHEMWARSMERYFMEGKAPTPTLGEAFASFARWLGKLYKVARDHMLVLRKTNAATGIAPISEDIRRVMDRLLATDEAIQAADDANAQRFHFKDAAEANMTDREFGAYQRTIEGSRSEAFAALLEETMARIKKERTAIYRGQRQRMRARVSTEIADRPVFKALAMLRGRDGHPRTPLDREGVMEVYGKEVVALLPQGVPPVVARRGMHPDTMAERVGLPDGRTLIEALIGIETNRKELVAAGDRRSPLDAAIDAETETRMAERHGDAFDDGSIEQEALRAIHNNQAADVLAAEARQLGKRIGAMPSSADIVRQWAERYVREGRVVDQASGAALARHQRAERAAGGEFERAMLAGDHDLAFRAKQRQQFAHALYRAAAEAKAQVDVIARRLDRLARAKTLKGMEQDFLDQIHGLLEDHDLRKRPEADVKQREKFGVWAKRMEEQGIEVFLPERLTMAGNTHFTRMVVGDLVALDDAVQSLAYLGREQKTINLAERKTIFEEIVMQTVAAAEQQPSRKFKATLNKPGSLARSVISSAVTVERIADFMDAYDPNGGFNQVLIRGARDAANTYAKLGNEVLEPIVRRYMDMPKAQRSRLFSRVTVPEFMAIDPDTREIKPMTMLRMDMIAIALNTGTASNLDKLIRGENLQFQQMVDYQLTEERLMNALNRELSEDDWRFVEGLWADVGKLWPHIAASEREITGIVPEKVEGRSVETAIGTLKGDYWPVVYDTDPNRSRWANFDANKNAEKDAQTMFGQIGRRIATNKGHTIERTEYAAPMLFSLEAVLFKHIRQVSTRAAYAVWARDALKFLDDPRIEEIVSRKLGREYFGQFHPWLRDQINDAALDTAELRGIDKIMRTARTNATAVGLVLRFTTLLTQVFGVANSIAEIGPGRVLQGYAKATMQVGKAQREAMALSPELERRGGEFDRDIQAALRDIAAPPRTALARAVDPAVRVRDRFNAFGFALIGLVQLHLVDIPLWIGGYEKGLAAGMTQDDAINAADKGVRKAQGASNAKDLAAIQRGREAYRIMTTFYTFFGTVLNYQWETAQAVRSGNYKRAISHSFWVMIVGPLLSALFMSPPDDDEDWATWAMRNIFFGLWGGVPILRDFANKWNREMAGQYAGDPQTPAGRIVSAVQGTAADGVAALGQTQAYRDAQEILPSLPDQKPPSDKWLQHLIETGGYLTGTGTGQAAVTTQYVVDVAEGEQHPQGAKDIAAGVIKGPRKDQK